MTREHKLALIVGFSLILLVGVLISDHLSRARQAKIASISANENVAPVAAVTPTTDPLRALDVALGASPPANTTPLASAPLSVNPSPASGGGAPLAAAPSAPAAPNQDSQPIVSIAQGRHGGLRTNDPDASLARAVHDQNGMIIQRADGTQDIVLPPAVMPSPGTSTPLALRDPISVGPRAGMGKMLATNDPIEYHAVQKGETLFEISTKYYGTGHLWHELARFNGVTNKDGVVRMGMKLKIPSKDALLGKTTSVETVSAPGPASNPPAAKTPAGKKTDLPGARPEIKYATYTVKKGETLGEISRKVLGTSKRWQELAEFNKIDDEDAIAAGTVLKVPPMRG